MTIDQIIRDNKDRQREAEMRRGAEVVARLKNLPNGRW